MNSASDNAPLPSPGLSAPSAEAKPPQPLPSAVTRELLEPSTELFQIHLQSGALLAGKYELIRVLGSGGVGVVAAARHVALDEIVALKTVRPELATHASAIARFATEARAGFKIRSQHVPRVLDVGTLENGLPFIAMELVEGQDLRAVLDSGDRLEIVLAVTYSMQVCEALAGAHALQIVHCDLKPENLLLTGVGVAASQIKLIDFGIATVLSTDGPAAADDTPMKAVGTPAYMSPEQLSAPRALDARSDIWSLGCVLYELLTGTSPFRRSSQRQSCVAVLAEDPDPPRALRPDIPQSLNDVVLRCLQKDPDARYQNVAEVAEALAPFGSKQVASYVDRCRRLLRGARLEPRRTSDAAYVGRVSATPVQRRNTSWPYVPDARGGHAGSHVPAGSTEVQSHSRTTIPRAVADGARSSSEARARPAPPSSDSNSVAARATWRGRGLMSLHSRAVGSGMALIIVTMFAAGYWLARRQVLSRQSPQVAQASLREVTLQTGSSLSSRAARALPTLPALLETQTAPAPSSSEDALSPAPDVAAATQSRASTRKAPTRRNALTSREIDVGF